jgi:DNA-directed RNA polymerase subunit RPC12/RpoP
LLGGIFIIAWGIVNLITGGIMLLIAGLLLFLVYRSDKIEASQPKLINQTFNVEMSGSGQLEQKQMQCRSCGAPLDNKDLSVVQGGIMVKCPYCGSVYAMEEAPKW